MPNRREKRADVRRPELRLGKVSSPLRGSETRLAEVFTVGWMLTVMTTALCELGAAIAHFTAGGGPGPLGLLGAYLFFSALILGLLSLLLAGIVFKIRKQRPPRGVTLVAVAIAAAPAVLWLVNAVS